MILGAQYLHIDRVYISVTMSAIAEDCLPALFVERLLYWRNFLVREGKILKFRIWQKAAPIISPEQTRRFRSQGSLLEA